MSNESSGLNLVDVPDEVIVRAREFADHLAKSRDLLAQLLKMMADADRGPKTNEPIRLRDLTLDYANNRLWRHGVNGPEEIVLQHQQMKVLRYLMENAGDLCTKREILVAAWSARFAEYGTTKTLTMAVSVLRKMLNTGDDKHEYIETVTHRGYRFRTEEEQSTHE